MIFNFLSIGDKLVQIIKDAFGVNLTEFLINLGATILLIIIVRFFFWNKVTNFLDAKKEKIKNDYKEADDIKKEALELKDNAQKELDEAKLKASDIVSNATVEAQIEKTKILESAKTKSEKIISDSKEEALREKEEALKSAKGEIVNIASMMASKMIDDNIDQSKYNNSILKELDK